MFLGTLVYTLGAYFATFWLVSYVGIKHASNDSTDDGNHDTNNSYSWEGCAWQCFVDKVFYSRQTEQYTPILTIPPTAFIILRITFSLSTAINTYRTVRRRTMVWMPSTTKKQRRMSVRETDKSTLLGRIRSGMAKKKHNWLSNRKERKIKKASSRFDKRNQSRKRRRRKFSEGSALFEGEHHDRVLQLGGGTTKS